MKKVYILTNGLAYKFGGRTKSIFVRAKMLADLNYDVEILFVGLDFNHYRQFEVMYKEWNLSKNIKLRSIWQELKKTTGIKKYPYLNANDQYEQEVCKFGYFPVDNDIEYCRHIIPNTKNHNYVDYLDHEQTLIRRCYYPTQKSMTHVKYFNSDGSVCFTANFIQGKKLNEMINIDYFNGRYDKGYFNSIYELKAMWLNNIIGNESAYLFSDARIEDQTVQLINLPNIKIFYIFHTIHTIIKDKNKITKKFKPIIKKGLGSEEIIVLTNEQKEDILLLKEYGGIKVNVIGHPLNRQIIKEKYNNKRFIVISRLVKSKKIEDVIYAFELFSRNNKEYSLDIYGQGELQDELQALINNLKLSNSITLCGYTNKVYEELQNSLAMINTTAFEGFGMSVGESIINGCPVISYEYRYGLKELVVNNKNGYIVKENNINELAKTMEVVINNQQNRQEISNSLDKYSTENIKKLWQELLN